MHKGQPVGFVVKTDTGSHGVTSLDIQESLMVALSYTRNRIEVMPLGLVLGEERKKAQDALKFAEARVEELGTQRDEAEQKLSEIRDEWDHESELAEEAERERDEAEQKAFDQHVLVGEAHTKLETAQQALATARKQALEEVAEAFETRPATEAMLCPEIALYCREQAAEQT